MYIYPSSPESQLFFLSEETAAITIQKSFRGYRVRKQFYSKDKKPLFNRHSVLSYQKLRRQKLIMDQSIDKDTSELNNASGANISVEDRCATKIQAGVRGFLVRKKQKIEADAATKIQAGFRGFKARKETEKLKRN